MDEPAQESTAGPRLSLANIGSYAAPLAALQFMTALASTYYVKFGVDTLLIAPGVIGVLYGSSRLFEALFDPVAGYLSDRTRSRLGRRRSWMAASVLPFIVGAILMWVPPAGLSGFILYAWIGVGAFCFAAAQSSFQIPHAALGAEMSRNSRDRVRCYGANSLMGVIGSAAGLVLGIHWLRTAESPRQTALVLFGGLGLLLIASTLTAIRRTREPEEHLGRGAESAGSAFLDVWKNPHARMLIFIGFFIQTTYGVLATTAPFALDYVFDLGDSIEIFMACFFIPTLLSIPFWVMLTRRFEKRHLWMVCLGLGALAYGGMGFAPSDVSIGLIGACAALAGFAGGGPFVFEPSLRAEVIDYDEFITGERKEGVYSASSQLAGKAAGAVMTMFVGLVLGWVGYVANAEQSEGVVRAIRTLFGGLPSVALIAALLLLLRYRLTEKRYTEISLELDRRSSAR